MSTLLVTVESGLGDRIGALLTGRRMAAALKRDFLYYWPKTVWCNARFEDVLKTDEPCVTETDPWPNETLLDYGAWDYQRVLESLSFIYNEVLKMRGYARRYDQEEFGSVVRFSDQVAELAAKYNGSYFREQMIGLHIRGTDYRTHMPDVRKYVATVAEIGFKQPDSQLFVCSDERRIINQIQFAFPTKVLTYPVRSLNRDEPEAIVDAAVQLCLLRQCQTLVLSRYSQFSRLACNHLSIEEYKDGDNPIVTVENNI